MRWVLRCEITGPLRLYLRCVHVVRVLIATALPIPFFRHAASAGLTLLVQQRLRSLVFFLDCFQTGLLGSFGFLARPLLLPRLLLLHAHSQSQGQLRGDRRVETELVEVTAAPTHASAHRTRRLSALAQEDGCGDELVAQELPSRRDDDQVTAFAALHLLVELLELALGLVV